MTRSIAHICYFDPDTYPGIYNSANILVEHGWQVDVIALDLYGFKANRFDPRVRLLRLTGGSQSKGGGWGPYFRFIHLVRRTGRERRWNAVFGHDMMGFLAARLSGGASASRIAFWSQDLAEPVMMTTGKRVLFALKQRFLRQCPLILAPSDTRATLLRRLYHFSSEPLVVYNSPRLEIPVPSGSDERRRFGFTPADRVGIYAGGLGDLRLVPELIDSVAAWPTEAKLLLAGYGTDAEIAAVRRRITERGLDGRIRFAGHSAEPFALIAAADFGLSLFRTESERRNFAFRGLASNKVFECLALGKPVVVSQNKETEEFIRRHRCGVCVMEPTPGGIAEAVRKLISSPLTLLEMQKQARAVHLSETHFEKRFQPLQKILEMNALSWRP